VVLFFCKLQAAHNFSIKAHTKKPADLQNPGGNNNKGSVRPAQESDPIKPNGVSNTTINAGTKERRTLGAVDRRYPTPSTSMHLMGTAGRMMR